MGNYEQFFNVRKGMAMKFSLYYFSQDHGEYLRELVAAVGIGQVKQFQDLSGLGCETETDVVLVEYEDNNLQLDTGLPNLRGHRGARKFSSSWRRSRRGLSGRHSSWEPGSLLAAPFQR